MIRAATIADVPRIAALVGEGRVGKAKLLDTHRSEGFAMERFTVPSAALKDRSTQTEQVAQAALALRRLRPPAQLTMQLDAQAPRAFFFEGKRYAVQQAYGPWRRSGEEDWLPRRRGASNDGRGRRRR